MIVKLLTEHHLEFLSLKGGCRGSSESTHVKIPNCWKSHALAQFFFYTYTLIGELSNDPDNTFIGRLMHVACLWLGSLWLI